MKTKNTKYIKYFTSNVVCNAPCPYTRVTDIKEEDLVRLPGFNNNYSLSKNMTKVYYKQVILGEVFWHYLSTVFVNEEIGEKYPIRLDKEVKGYFSIESLQDIVKRDHHEQI